VAEYAQISPHIDTASGGVRWPLALSPNPRRERAVRVFPVSDPGLFAQINTICKISSGPAMPERREEAYRRLSEGEKKKNGSDCGARTSSLLTFGSRIKPLGYLSSCHSPRVISLISYTLSHFIKILTTSGSSHSKVSDLAFLFAANLCLAAGYCAIVVLFF
jgi:hypothetical protein